MAARSHIGDLILMDGLITSEFGDTHLFFQHVRVQEDFTFWNEEWKQQGIDAEQCFATDDEDLWGNKIPEGVWPKDDAAAEKFYTEQIKANGCPFAWLYQNK